MRENEMPHDSAATTKRDEHTREVAPLDQVRPRSGATSVAEDPQRKRDEIRGSAGPAARIRAAEAVSDIASARA